MTSYGSSVASFADKKHSQDMATANQQASSNPQTQYASSTYSTSTTATEAPLLSSSNQSPKSNRTSKAWEKTKSILSSIGEPPTEKYDREQEAIDKANGKIAQRKVPSHQDLGGPFSRQPWLGRYWGRGVVVRSWEKMRWMDSWLFCFEQIDSIELSQISLFLREMF